MNSIVYEIKDDCRKNLIIYTIRAFSEIPKIDKPLILDIGCGTGVGTLALAEISDGMIYAVDIDRSCLVWLKGKVNASGLEERIKIIHASVFNLSIIDNKFDIIIAEGLLNVIGFEKGLPLLLKKLKYNGYLIVHDEYKDDSEKNVIYKKYNLKIICSFQLNEDVWWYEYYLCLEKKIAGLMSDRLFKSEMDEIAGYKLNPKNYRSVFYVLQNLK